MVKKNSKSWCCRFPADGGVANDSDGVVSFSDSGRPVEREVALVPEPLPNILE